MDFLPKPFNDTQLLEAVAKGIGKSLHESEAQAELESIQQRLERLTPREREVMEFIIAGRLNKEVADRLGTVEKTIKVHRARVLEKMQVHSLAELVHLTERAGIHARAISRT